LTLDLSGNRLTDLPEALLRMDRLQGLNLSGNPLGTLPPEIGALTALPAELGQLSQLYALDLSGNRLAVLSDSTAVWEQMAEWPNRLIQLDLSNNQLAEAPPFSPRLRLEVLNLSHNQLTDLPLDLDQLTNLTHLDLSHNRFSGIPPVLSRLHPLLSLDLRGNPLTACLLPLPWQIDRYIYPPPKSNNVRYDNFDYRLLSPMPGTEPSDLPFLELCLE